MISRRSNLLVILLLAAAAILPFLFFHHGVTRYHCVYDLCTPERAVWGKFVQKLGTPSPLVNLHTRKLILFDGKPLTARPMYQRAEGIVVRDGIPTTVGMFGGLVLPIVLLVAAVILLNRGAVTEN